MQIVIPMAGVGRRFSEAGYVLPKPLIPVLGVPMVVRAVRDLPPAERLIFICQREHVVEHRIDKIIEDYFPGCHVVVASGLTAGQACSVRLAAEHLDRDGPVLVAACDNTHLYDRERLARLIADQYNECLIWTYRRDPRVLVRPQAHGWVQADPAGRVIKISVKIPLSMVPLEDHAVSGCFWFRTAGTMIDGIDTLVSSNARVNGEFYLDSVPEGLLAENRGVGIFEVDKYIGWGTPADLEDFLRWRYYFELTRQAA